MGLSRTLGDISFIVFSCGLQHLFASGLRPFTLQVQGVLEPSVFARAERRVLRFFAASLSMMPLLRGFFRVVCLLRQHVPECDLAQLLKAFRYSKFGRCFPTIFDAAVSILTEMPPRIGRTILNVPTTLDATVAMCLGPHCQCYAREKQHEAEWIRRREGQGQQGQEPRAPHVVIRNREVSVPSYVAQPEAGPSGFKSFSCGCSAGEKCKSYCSGLLAVQARYQVRPRRRQNAPGFFSLGMFRSHFRHRENKEVASVCQVRHSAYIIHNQVDEALVGLTSLFEHMLKEMSDILGGVGMNEDMGQLLKDSATAWDWSHLLFAPPTAQHTIAFRGVWRKLRGLLSRSEFPSGEVFERVEKCWPTEENLCVQYLCLARRARTAFQCAKVFPRPLGEFGSLGLIPTSRRPLTVPAEVSRLAFDWVEVTGYEVRPVWVHVFVLHVCDKCGLGVGLAAKKIGGLLSLFLGGLPTTAYVPTSVRPAELRPPGKRHRRRSKTTPRLERHQWRAGDIAVLPNKRLVFVTRVVRHVCVQKVTAAIISNPWFSLGVGSGGLIAWHACRLAHRCSVMFPPEAPCERIGSLMRFVWEPRQHLGPVAVADRVYLSQAGVECVGSTRDEMLVDIIASLLESTSKYKMTLGNLGAQPLPFKLRGKAETAEASGRFS